MAPLARVSWKRTFCVAIGCTCWLNALHSDAQVEAPTPSVQEIVARIREARARRPHFRMEFVDHSSVDVMGTLENRIPDSEKVHTYTLWSKDADFDVTWTTESKNPEPTENDVNYRHSYIMSERELAFISNSVTHRLAISHDADTIFFEANRLKAVMIPMNDYLAQGDYPFDMIMELAAADLRVRKRMENIDGSPCYVIEGETAFGDYELWIDPGHDYQLRKAIVRKEPGDLISVGRALLDGTRTPKIGKIAAVPGMDLIEFTLEVVKLQEVGGAWFLAQLQRHKKVHYEDGSSIRIDKEIKVQAIEIDPDFESEGAFSTDFIPDGTTVRLREAPGLRYEWRDGDYIPYLPPDLKKKIEESVESASALKESNPEAFSGVAKTPALAVSPSDSIGVEREESDRLLKIGTVAIIILASLVFVSSVLILRRQGSRGGTGSSTSKK